MSFLFRNNFAQKLAASLDQTATSLVLDGGMSDLTDASPERVAVMTLFDPYNPEFTEIVYCTGSDGSALTVERGKEGTTAQSWPADTACEMRLTAGVMGAVGYMVEDQLFAWGEYAEISKDDPADSTSDSMIFGTYVSGTLAAGEYDAMTAFGTYATVGSQGSAFGAFADAEKDGAAFGCYAGAEPLSVAFGVYAAASSQAVAIGNNADAREKAIHIDSSEYGIVRSAYSLGIGWWAEDQAGADFSTFLGAMSSSAAVGGSTLGAGSHSAAAHSVAVGLKASSTVESGFRMTAIPYLPKQPDAHPYDGDSDFALLPDPLPAAKRTATPVVLATDDLDLTDATATAELALPPNTLFFPDRFDLVVTNAVTPGGAPKFQIGTDATAADTLLAATAVTSTAAGQREQFAPAVPDGITALHVSVADVATGTLAVRIVAHGYVMEV